MPIPLLVTCHVRYICQCKVSPAVSGRLDGQTNVFLILGSYPVVYLVSLCDMMKHINQHFSSSCEMLNDVSRFMRLHLSIKSV